MEENRENTSSYCVARLKEDIALKKLLLFSLLMLLTFLISCEAFRGTQPIPQEKESFIGVWKSHSGYTLDIRATGTATIRQVVNSKDPEYNALNITVAPQVIEDIRVEFENDTILRIIKPLVYAKEFRIDHVPSRDSNETTMILNGVRFIKQQ